MQRSTDAGAIGSREVPGMRIIRNAEEGKQLLALAHGRSKPKSCRWTCARRPSALSAQELSPDEVVRRIIRDVREDGDNAVRYYNSKLDGATVGDLKVSRDEIAAAYDTRRQRTVEALKFAAERVRRYHETAAARGDVRLQAERPRPDDPRHSSGSGFTSPGRARRCRARS